MDATYPQETMGTTLLNVFAGGERRRILLQRRQFCMEVGEFTSGPLTQDFFNAPAHYHCIHLEFDDMDLAAPEEFFSQATDDVFLADFMDSLDARGVKYGYLSNTACGHIIYRPAKAQSRICAV